MIHIVGLKGYAGSGKSSVAVHLAAEHHYHRLSFATPLKEMLRAFGLSQDELFGTLKCQPCAKLGGRTPRYAQQMLGTEWGRYMIDPDLWVKSLDRYFRICCDAGIKRFVIDDVRFRNEASWLRNLNQVMCVGAPHFNPEPQKAIIVGLNRKTDEGHHASEVEQLSIESDFVIENNRTIDELYSAIDNILTEVYV